MYMALEQKIILPSAYSTAESAEWPLNNVNVFATLSRASTSYTGAMITIISRLTRLFDILVACFFSWRRLTECFM